MRKEIKFPFCSLHDSDCILEVKKMFNDSRYICEHQIIIQSGEFRIFICKEKKEEHQERCKYKRSKLFLLEQDDISLKWRLP